jgi:NifU-like protein involved in Fe-S cluster formation
VTSAPAYSARVRALFADPPGAGELSGEAGERRRGEAGSPGQGAWVSFEARVEDGRIAEAAFRAWGCPHVIAAAALVAGRLAGLPPGDAGRFDVHALAAELDLPPQKLGRLLVVQDAAAALGSPGARSG